MGYIRKTLGAECRETDRVYGVLQNKELIQISTDDTLGGVLGARAQGAHGVNDLVQFIGMEEGLEPHIFDVDTQELRTYTSDL